MTSMRQSKAPRHRGETNAALDFSHLERCDFAAVQRVAADAVARHEAEKGAHRLGRAMQAEMSKPRAGFRGAF